MNSKTDIVFSIALILAGSAAAQSVKPLSFEEVKQQRLESYSGGPYLTDFFGELYYRTDEGDPINTAHLLITYDLTVQWDTMLRHDLVAAEVGDRYAKFHSLYLLELLKNYTYSQRKYEAWTKGCDLLDIGHLRSVLQSNITDYFYSYRLCPVSVMFKSIVVFDKT